MCWRSYALCLLLGFRGRYSMSGQESVRSIVATITEKLDRIRGGPHPLSPNWAPPEDALTQQAYDPWVRRLFIGTLGAFSFAFLLFLVVQIRVDFRGIGIALDRSAGTPLGSTREHHIEILDRRDCPSSCGWSWLGLSGHGCTCREAACGYSASPWPDRRGCLRHRDVAGSGHTTRNERANGGGGGSGAGDEIDILIREAETRLQTSQLGRRRQNRQLAALLCPG